MADYIRRREESQPVKDRSAGSTFRNPAGYSSTGEAGDPMDLKAWKLIDDAGCRGLRLGGAQMSEKHPNFLINTGERHGPRPGNAGRGGPRAGEIDLGPRFDLGNTTHRGIS